MSNKKYIDVEKAKAQILANAVNLNRPQFLVKDAVMFILDNIPPADVEKVVRCRNCIHYDGFFV